MMAIAMNVPVRASVDLRLLRAAVFSAVCVALSATGHVLASGAGIPLWSWAAGWAVVLCGVVPMAGRERSLPAIAVTLLAGEAGLHLLFFLGQNSATPAPADRSDRVVALAERLLCNGEASHLTPRSAARILRQARIDPAKAWGAVHGAPGMAGMTGHSAHAMTLSSMLTPAMLAAHLVAVLVAGWVLRRGEAALWQAVRLPAMAASRLARLTLLVRLGRLLAAVRIPALVVDLLKCLRPALVRRCSGGVRRLRSSVLQTCVIRRGPPAVAAAV
jgi:hypothetical protein